VICFKMCKFSDYIFHLHFVTESENVDRSVETVKLLRLNWGSFGETHRAG
jgi:hypothetical protein